MMSRNVRRLVVASLVLLFSPLSQTEAFATKRTHQSMARSSVRHRWRAKITHSWLGVLTTRGRYLRHRRNLARSKRLLPQLQKSLVQARADEQVVLKRMDGLSGTSPLGQRLFNLPDQIAATKGQIERIRTTLKKAKYQKYSKHHRSK